MSSNTICNVPLQPVPLHRLSESSYSRPNKTYTDTLQTDQEIRKKLDGFIEIEPDEIDTLQPGSFIRYITLDKKKGKEVFRTGGVLVTVYPYYIVLRGKDNVGFSAQRYIRKNERNNDSDILYTTRFFKKINNEEKLKIQLEELEDNALKALTAKDKEIEILKNENDELKDTIRKLAKEIKKYRKNT